MSQSDSQMPVQYDRGHQSIQRNHGFCIKGETFGTNGATALSSIEELVNDGHWSPSDFGQESDGTWADIDSLREDSQTDLRLDSCAYAYGVEPDVASSSGFVEDYGADANAVFRNVALQQLNCDVGSVLLFCIKLWPHQSESSTEKAYAGTEMFVLSSNFSWINYRPN